MPESRHKFLYERLGDHDFQLLVIAVLTHAFPGFMPLPLRQSEGGRDGILQTAEPAETLIVQVKWSVNGREKDPVGWLDSAIRGEEKNLRRLAGEGVRRYMLITNVPSTGKPGTGTFDRLNDKLVAHAKSFGFEQMTCLWREALDAQVDSAPNEVKWQYADMLAGWDLIRYLINSDAVASRDRGLRDLLSKIAATQWRDDELVKFRQSDVDRESLADLFVDITAERLRSLSHSPARGGNATLALISRSASTDVHVDGAAKYLLGTDIQATLVRGAPGQGKSTLSQYVSQAHRAAFIPPEMRTVDLPTPPVPRFPLRFDLSEYARWLQGIDVFDQTETGAPAKSIKRPSQAATIECFLADLMTWASGGIPIDAREVQETFRRLPALVVLDGLDEVGSPKTRRSVVAAIDHFARRGQTYPVPLQIVVTTRPSTNELPEPEPELFEVIVLNQLTIEQRNDYLRRWCAVRGIRAREGREMRKSFKEKSAEPYIGELAGNPMQLTILLDLIHERGAATPTQRTELYDAYVDLLLAREANKHPGSVRKHRDQLLEVVPFLGWYLQSRSEEASLPGRMKLGELKAAMRHFQHCYAKPEKVVDELFEAASDRMWALTSKSEGTYEFEVLSLREYFAARFLYRYAGEESRGFDRSAVLRELLRRPYWLNTARFYGGNAHGGDIVVLSDGILDELAARPTPQSRIAAWTLVTDGVFHGRPRQGREVIEALLKSDDDIAVLLDALGRNEIRPLPEPLSLPVTEGPDPTWMRLTNQIATNPADEGNRRRVRALRELLNQRPAFAQWWAEQMRGAVGTSTEHAWLLIAAQCEAAAGMALDLDGLDLTAAGTAALALNTGLVPTSGGEFESNLARSVLAGDATTVTSTRSMPAQLAVAFGPDWFYDSTETGFVDVDERAARRRSDAIARLRTTAPALGKAAMLRRFKRGEKGSTFPWSNVAAALFDHAGRCWLASEIALIGAASPRRSGFARMPESEAFGHDSHPATLLAQTRAHAREVQWWRKQLAVLNGADLADDLSRAEWALALWAVASGPVITELFTEWESLLAGLSAQRRRVVHRAAWNIAIRGWLKNRHLDVTATEDDIRQLLALRVPQAPQVVPRQPGGRLRTPPPVPAPLATVARERNWFRVDDVPTYR